MTTSVASPSLKSIVLPSIHTLDLPMMASPHSPDSGYASDDIMPWKASPGSPSFNPTTGHRARQLSGSSNDSRLSATPPPPARHVTRFATGADLRTPSPPALEMPAISRHRTKPTTPQAMTPSGYRAFTISLPTPATARGAPSHVRLVPARNLDEADAAVLVHAPTNAEDKPRSLLLVGPENLRRVRSAGRMLGRTARVHPYRIVRVAATQA